MKPVYCMASRVCHLGRNTDKLGFPGGSDSKESACNAGDLDLILGREVPWRRKWQTTPVLLPGEFHSMDREAWQATAHGVIKSRT